MGIKLFKLFEADGQPGGRKDGQRMANSIVPLPHFVRRGTKKSCWSGLTYHIDKPICNLYDFLSTNQFISEFWGIM